MAKKVELKLLQPDAILRNAINKKIDGAFRKLTNWAKKNLPIYLTYGGGGVQGIADTDFYKFLISPQGLSELGIEQVEPLRLLQAYYSSFQVTSNFSSRIITIEFGDSLRLKAMTPHPASGTGKLQIESWLEWIVDGKRVDDAGFVPASRLPERAKKYIRISSAPGGLMLPARRLGSFGTWAFPSQFKNYEEDWLNTNIPILEKIITDRFITYFNGS